MFLRSFPRTTAAIVFALFGAVSSLVSAQITPHYYDNNGIALGIGSAGSAGVWGETIGVGSVANWNTSSAGGDPGLGLIAWPNFIDASAIFSGTGNVVRVDRVSTVLSAGIEVQSSGYLFRIPTTNARTFVGEWTLGLASGVNVTFDGRNADGSTSSAGRAMTIDSVRHRTGAPGSSSVTLETFSSGSNVFQVNIANNGTFAVPLTITGTGAANLVGVSAAIVDGSVTGNGSTLHFGATSGNSLTINGSVNNGAGNVQFGVGGTGGGDGLVVLGNGAKTWQNTIINLGANGIVRLNGANALPTGTTVIFDSNSTLELNGLNRTIAGLSSGAANGNVRNQSAVASTLTINGSGSTTFSGSISNGVGGGALSLVRSGSGSTTLSGNNTYSGSTTVSGGSLVIDGTHTGGSSVSVTGGELKVNGSLTATTFDVSAPGTVSGTGAITSAEINVSGTISPGSSIGNMAVNGNLNLNAGSTLDYELQTNGLDGDLIHIVGNLNIANGAFLTVSDLNVNIPVISGSKLTMVSYTGSWNGGLLTLGATQLANNDIFMVSGQEWQIRYDDGAGGTNFAANQAGASGFLTLTAVPEPSALLFVGSVLGLGFLRRRRS